MGVTPLGTLLALGWVSSKGDTTRGIVGGRVLGLACSVTSTGHVGGEFGSGQQEGIIDASGLSDEGDDKKTDPVEEKSGSMAVGL